MKNFMVIKNGKVNVSITLTDDELKELVEKYGHKTTKLADVPVGDTVKIGSWEFIVLEHNKDTTAVILKDCLFTKEKFGDDNNYEGSHADRVCNRFARCLSDLIGFHNIIEHTVDLTADDGLKCYGSVKSYASLLTANLYRKYVDILDRYNPGISWWLSTAYSTPKHENNTLIKCVTSSGDVNSGGCCYACGIRPFLTLNSSVSVSKGE